MLFGSSVTDVSISLRIEIIASQNDLIQQHLQIQLVQSLKFPQLKGDRWSMKTIIH
jgi:hypothetical protein